MREYENPMVNQKTLKLIATKTKGDFVPIYHIDQLPEKIKPVREVIFSETKERELWDTFWVFLIFLLVIMAEWIIRKLVRLI